MFIAFAALIYNKERLIATMMRQIFLPL